MHLYVDANFASPYALVAFVSLLEKKAAFDLKTVDLAVRANENPEFVKTSITRRIPTLVQEGFTLSESSAICEYIEDTFSGTRLYPSDPQDRARARQVQAWVRSDLMPIRDERPTFVVFCGAQRPALSPNARAAAEKLFSGALALLDGRSNNLFAEWSIADVDLAMMLQRLISLGDPMPQRLVDYANFQWNRPSVQRWVHQKRPPLVEY